MSKASVPTGLDVIKKSAFSSYYFFVVGMILGSLGHTVETQPDTLAYLGFDNMITSPRLSPDKLLRNVGIPFGICWDLKLCAGDKGKCTARGRRGCHVLSA